VAGYTGSSCGTLASAACTATDVGEVRNATIGSAIPGVLQRAAELGLALDGQRLLGLFSREDLSCQVQNALVTFIVAIEVRNENSATYAMRKRQQTTFDSGQAATTTDGLVVDAAPSPTSPQTSSIDSSLPTSTDAPDLDSSGRRASFAGAVVLYILQSTSNLNQATTAQTKFQDFFTGEDRVQRANDIDLGSGWSADLDTSCLRAGNGTTVGAC